MQVGVREDTITERKIKIRQTADFWSEPEDNEVVSLKH